MPRDEKCPAYLENTSLFSMGAVVRSREVGLVGRKTQRRGLVGSVGVVYASVQGLQQLYLVSSRSAGSENFVEVVTE